MANCVKSSHKKFLQLVPTVRIYLIIFFFFYIYPINQMGPVRIFNFHRLRRIRKAFERHGKAYGVLVQLAGIPGGQRNACKYIMD